MNLPTRSTRPGPIAKVARIIRLVRLALTIIRITPGLTVRRTVRLALRARRFVRRVQRDALRLTVGAAGAAFAAILAIVLIRRRRRQFEEGPPGATERYQELSKSQADGGAEPPSDSELDVEGPNESAPRHEIPSAGNGGGGEGDGGEGNGGQGAPQAPDATPGRSATGG